MKRLSIYFLAFLTFWMSSWLVTDIHDWSIADADQPHPVFSSLQTIQTSDLDSVSHDHKTQCGVCSYDHGGHMGQSLATLFFLAESIPAENTLHFPLHSEFWHSRITTPKLRPPIA